jgi:hypothetical protein
MTCPVNEGNIPMFIKIEKLPTAQFEIWSQKYGKSTGIFFPKG